MEKKASYLRPDRSTAMRLEVLANKSCFISHIKAISVKISLKLRLIEKKISSLKQSCFLSWEFQWSWWGFIYTSMRLDTARPSPERRESCCSGRREFTGSDLPAGIEQLLRHSSWCLPKINSEGKVIFPSLSLIEGPLEPVWYPPAILIPARVQDFADFPQSTEESTSGR